MAEGVRIDKWLWAVRIYKTRTLASEEIRKHRVLINGLPVKPSRLVQVGEEIDVRKPPIVRTYRVLGLIENRVSAKVAAEYVADITPPEELEKLQMRRFNISGIRPRGTGRPTKKERRDLEQFLDFDE